MKHTEIKISDNDLHRYVDGELSAERAKQVADYLEQNPQDAQRVAEYQQLNAGLRLAHSNILHSAHAESLPTIKTGISRVKFKQFGIAASWLAIGIAIGWAVQSNRTTQIIASDTSGGSAIQQQLVRPARLSYATYTPEVLHPVEVDAEQQQHLAGWLTKRLGKTVIIPDLSGTGFSLLGGRLLPGEDKPAAMFMYENQAGQRITLNIVRSQEDATPTAFQFTEEQSIRTFYWIDNGFGYALSGEIGKPPLLSLANSVYHQLNL